MSKYNKSIIFVVILILWICLVANADGISIEELEEKAAELDKMFNVSAREYVEVYFELADAYHSMGELDKALVHYKKGLQLDPLNVEYQRKAAKVEIELMEYASAYRRLLFIQNKLEEAYRIYNEATALLSEIPMEIVDDEKSRVVTPLFSKSIVVAVYPGVDEEILGIICARISEEFKVNVVLEYLSVFEDESNLRDKHEEYYDYFIRYVYTHNHSTVIQEFMEAVGLTEKDLESKVGKEQFVREMIVQSEGETAWERLHNSIVDQYDADYQIQQIRKECKAYLADSDQIIGILAVTGKDIYSGVESNNFLFGLASGNVAVMSIYRFYSRGTPFEKVVQRSVRQSFASVGHVIGIPRCSSPKCARSYPHSLEEHDYKEDVLCGECIQNLNKKYQELLR
ncbi:MAG: tetratricopeptide repeat protein [Clostridiales bacterium]|nr:tetratricopeptide repeat protein [Clostridiales bacterium]